MRISEGWARRQAENREARRAVRQGRLRAELVSREGLEPSTSFAVGQGYDALKDDYGDMFAKGIVDAAKVTRSALQHAASSPAWS